MHHFIAAVMIQNEWKKRRRRPGRIGKSRTAFRSGTGSAFVDASKRVSSALQSVNLPAYYGVQSAKPGLVELSVRNMGRSPKKSTRKFAVDEEAKSPDRGGLLGSGGDIEDQERLLLFKATAEVTGELEYTMSGRRETSREEGEDWCLTDLSDPTEMLTQLVVEIPFDDDEVAVVIAARKKPSNKRRIIRSSKRNARDEVVEV